MFPTEVLEKEKKELEQDDCTDEYYERSKQHFNNNIRQAFVNQAFESSVSGTSRDYKLRRKSTIVIVEKPVDLELLGILFLEKCPKRP